MRYTIILARILGLLAVGVRVGLGASVTVGWDTSSDPNVVGYNLYYGSASGVYTNIVSAGGATSAGVSNLLTGVTYYFAATYYNEAGLESDYSMEISYTAAASSALRFTRAARVGSLLELSWTGGTPPYRLQMMTNFANPKWVDVAMTPSTRVFLVVHVYQPAVFYRIAQ